MKKYVFSCFDDRVGEEKAFSTPEEAVKYAKEDWRHMTDKERNKYLWHHVYEIEATPEQMEDIEAGRLSADDFWTADILDDLKEHNRDAE